MLLRIVSIIFPLFAIVLAGWFYGRRHKPDMALANQLNMDVFVPALVFAALAGKSFDLVSYQALAVGGIAVVLGSGLLAWPLARLLQADTKTFLPPMMFNNSGNMGLPLAVLAFGEAALPAAVVLFLVENLLHFSLGAWMLDHRARLVDLWRMPMMLAALAGLAVEPLRHPAVAAAAHRHPHARRHLHSAAAVHARRAPGRRLLPCLGDRPGRRRGAARAGHADCLGRAGWALGLSPQHQAMLLVFGALPPAVLNYVFAERYAQEPDKVASIVMVGNVAALLFIPVALAIAL
jgi:predicted permease